MLSFHACLLNSASLYVIIFVFFTRAFNSEREETSMLGYSSKVCSNTGDVVIENLILCVCVCVLLVCADVRVYMYTCVCVCIGVCGCVCVY